MDELRIAAEVLEAAVETAVAAAERAKGQQPSDKLVTSCYFAIFALLSACICWLVDGSVTMRGLNDAQCCSASLLSLLHLASLGTLMSAMSLRWYFHQLDSA